jgi:hypothetical protein
MAFFHCHQRKKNWFNDSYAWSMILNLLWLILKRSVTGMWKKYSDCEYFIFCWLLSFKSIYS